MPLYNYKCRKYGTEFETFNTIKNRKTAICDCCSGIADQTVSRPRYRGDAVFNQDNLEHLTDGPVEALGITDRRQLKAWCKENQKWHQGILD